MQEYKQTVKTVCMCGCRRDHLEGTLYVDRMATRSFVTADQAKALYAGKPIAEIKKALGL